MRETERRIKLYRARLPKIREKIIATLLVFAVSAAAMAVATFSWITLSMAPEVKGASTSVAANGNLEIALATNSSTAPGSSQIGDSTLALIQRNNTWGNLINLSDPSYGLSNLVMYPAVLNKSDLLNTPLHSIHYSADGRVTTSNTTLGYVAWKGAQFEQTDSLGVRAITSMAYGEDSASLGLKYDARMKLDAIGDRTANLSNRYKALGKNDTYMNSLAKLMVGYMAHRIKTSTSQVAGMINESNISNTDVAQLDEMYGELIECYKELAAIYADYFNLLTMIKTGAQPSTPVTADDILNMEFNTSSKTAYNALINKYGADYIYGAGGFIADMDQFLRDYSILVNDKVNIGLLLTQQYASRTSVVWTSLIITGYTSDVVASELDENGNYTLSSILNRLTTVKNCKIIERSSGKEYTVGGIGGSAALELKGKTCDAIIVDGVLKNFENRCGSRIETNRVTMSIGTSIGTQTVYAHISTNANTDFLAVEKTKASSAIDAMEGSFTMIAKDGYGFAIDTWVRTNNANSYLILEGSIIPGYEDVKQTITYQGTNGIENHEVTIYEVTKTITQDYPNETLDPSSMETFDVYQRPDDNKTWYYLSDNTVADLTNPEPVPSEDGTYTIRVSYSTPTVKTKTIVVGYSGVNRIWNEEGDSAVIDPTKSTTQGSGSCYIFYADKPEDREQILSLLSAMKIAFVDGVNGTLLAEAELATDLYFADSGKVIVPIQLSDKVVINDSEEGTEDTEDTESGDSNNEESSGSVGVTDAEGNLIKTITPLEKNVPILITSIVYIDGSELTNDMAFSVDDIMGSFNIQFGAYESPDPLRDENLEKQQLVVSATFTDGTTEKTFGNDDTDFTVGVKLTVEGIDLSKNENSKVTARFIRKVNSTQGSRENEFEFNTQLEGQYVFTAPGEYVLRSVTIGGVEYDLQGVLTVSVPGIQITNISSTRGAYYTTYTSDNFITDSVSITVKAGSNYGTDGKVHSVQGVFMNEKNVNITTNYELTDENNGIWTADITFNSSGTYTMQYVIIDGEYFDLKEQERPILIRDLHMGMTAAVYIETDLSQFDQAKEECIVNALTDDVVYKCYGEQREFVASIEISDNAGNRITNLNNVQLVYGVGEGEITTEGMEWDANKGITGEGRFVGSLFVFDPGVYSFTKVTTSSGVISVATRAPVITAQATEPVKYLSVQSTVAPNGRVLDLKNDKDSDGDTQSASITLSFENAQSAVAFALFKKVAPDTNKVMQTTYRVIASEQQSGNTRTFYIPEEDGYWSLEAVKMAGVYDGENFFSAPTSDDDKITAGTIASDLQFTSNSAYYSVPTDSNWPKNVKVVADINLTFDNGQGIVLGKNSDGTVTGTFLQTHTGGIKGITLNIKDFDGKPLEENVSVTLRYQYNQGTSGTYGKYTSSSPLPSSLDINMTDSNGDSKFEQSSAIDVQYAGKYSPTVMVTIPIGNSSMSIYYGNYTNDLSASEYKQMPTSAPTVEVYSNAPTVTIASISPSGTFNADTTGKGKGHQSVTTPAVTATEATVYFKCGYTGGCGSYHNLTHPSVVIKLEGIGAATQATLSFGADSHVYSSSGGTTKTGYSWTANGNCTRYIGYFSSRTLSDDDKTPAGDIQATELILTANGVSFTVSLNTPIKIHNPY